MEKLYAGRDIRALGSYYMRHVCAMTAEDLHSKSDIAAELAWRDALIDEMLAALEWSQMLIEECYDELKRHTNASTRDTYLQAMNRNRKAIAKAKGEEI